jgi:hypothetical protein
MTLEDLADLIRAKSANHNRRMEELHGESYGRILNLHSDRTDVRHNLKEVRASLNLAETLSSMKTRIETLEAEVASLRRRS